LQTYTKTTVNAVNKCILFTLEPCFNAFGNGKILLGVALLKSPYKNLYFKTIIEIPSFKPDCILQLFGIASSKLLPMAITSPTDF